MGWKDSCRSPWPTPETRNRVHSLDVGDGLPPDSEAAERTRDAFAERLGAAGFGEITTEIAQLGEFYYAEDYHQQYLAKNPDGYCGLGGTGVSCPVGVGATA